MTVLIIGIDGQIGKNLWEAWKLTGTEIYGTSRHPVGDARVLTFDLNNPANVDQLPKCDVAFLCAAETRIAVCRENPIGTSRINVEAPIAIAQHLTSHGCFVIFLSSHAVFDGSYPTIPVDAPTCPKTTYGQQKVAVETMILELGENAAILRLAKVLNPTLGLFKGWIELLKGRRPVTAFQDMVMAPIPLTLVTDILIRIAIEREGGIYQFSGAREISYVQAARHIACRLGADQKLVRILNCCEAGIPIGEVTRYATFDSSRVEALMGKSAPDPYEVMDNVFQFPLSVSSAPQNC